MQLNAVVASYRSIYHCKAINVYSQGSNKDGKDKPQMDDTEEDKINELGKDENDFGNLDDNFTDNKNDVKPDDVQPEDMQLPEDLDLDTPDNDEEENAAQDNGDGLDDNNCDDDIGKNDKSTISFNSCC